MSPCSLCTFFVCLIGVSLGLDLAQALHIPNQPENSFGSTKEIPRPTILSSMKHDLTSNFGPCSFPPEDVLSDYASDQSPFGFLKKCNVDLPLPKPEANSHIHKDAEVLLCMALYDIGLRMCGTNQTVHKRITNRIPHNALELQKVLNEDVDALLKQKKDSLCSSLQTVLYEPTAIQTQYWNLKKTFLTKKSACGKICLDYDDSENEFCKLIFWGSSLLRDSKSYDDSMGHNPTLPSGSQLEAQAASLSVVSDVVKDNRPNSQSEPEIQIVEHQPAISIAAEQDVKPNVPGSIMSIPTDSPLSSNGESNLNPKDESVHSKVPSSEENQKSLSISKAVNDEKIGKDTLPAVTREHPPTNFDDTKKNTIDRERKPDGTSTSNSKTGPTDIEPKKEIADKPRLAEKTSLDTILEQEKHVEGNNVMTIQSSKSSSSQQVSISKSTSTTESGIGMVQGEDSIQKVSENEGNQDMASEELPDEEPPLDQGEEDDDLNFPKADLEQPEKAGTSDNDNYFKTGSREEMTNGNVYVRDRFEQSEDSHFFGYFFTMVIFCFVGYFVFHNKQKILALAVEGRSRRGSNRRRPNTAKYHKLDSNLEEAVSSPCNTSVTHVIY